MFAAAKMSAHLGLDKKVEVAETLVQSTINGDATDFYIPLETAMIGCPQIRSLDSQQT